MNCPKCDADISDSLQKDDPDTGIVGGYYCDACDLPVEHSYEPMEGDARLCRVLQDRPVLGARLKKEIKLPTKMFTGREI